VTESVVRAPLSSVDGASAWKELFRKEDWWAIWIGVGIIAVAAVVFSNGGSIKWLAVAPQKWSHLSDVFSQLAQHGLRYGALLALWAAVFGLGLAFLGIGLTTRLRDFVSVGAKPFYAFTIGVVVNIALGFVLSTQVFNEFWNRL